MKVAAAVEARSEHPLAKAIVAHAQAQNLPLEECRAFRSYTGQGVQGWVGNRSIVVGNPKMLEQYQVESVEDLSCELSRLHDEGKTVILVGESQEDGTDNGQVMGREAWNFHRAGCSV